MPVLRGSAASEAAGVGVPANAERLSLRVSFPRAGEYREEDSRLYPLTASRWERLEIPLPADWRGGGLRLDPQCRCGLLEIVGVRIVSGVMGESLWEKLGRDLLDGVRVSAGMQVLSNRLRLRLLCTGEDAQIVLPDLALPGAEVPLVLELGLRVRTELASIGYSLHEWVDDANTKLRETREQLAIAEAARAYGEERATALLAEVDVARTDGNQREAALREQLAAAHEDARAHAAALTAEIDAARQDGRQQVAALNAQLTAAREAAQAHAAALTAEIDAARAHGEERAAALLAEVSVLRADGNQREAALREQLAAAHEAAREHTAKLTAEIEGARAHGEERAAALLAEVDAVRADGNQREAALREQLAAAHEDAREHTAKLTAEIEMARAYGEERAAALTAAIDEDQRQLLALRADQASELQKFEQTLALRRQQQDEIRAELAEARRSGEEHRGRVRSMQRSLSWRLTLPLRVIGRALTGRRPASRQPRP